MVQPRAFSALICARVNRDSHILENLLKNYSNEAQGGKTSPPFRNMTLNPLLAKYKEGPAKIVTDL